MGIVAFKNQELNGKSQTCNVNEGWQDMESDLPPLPISKQKIKKK
jgi:hypothetical protein